MICFVTVALALAPPSPGEILDNLTAQEAAHIGALEDAERHFVTSLLSGQLPKSRKDITELRTGSFFTLQPGRSYDLVQVVDETNLLMSFHVNRRIGGGGVRSVEDAFNRARTSRTVRELVDIVWVEGWATEDMSDGQSLTEPRIYYCMGNRQYDAVGGASTIMHLKTFSGDELAAMVEPIVEAHGFRIWGKNTPIPIVARFVRATRTRVYVRVPSGKQLKVKMSQLSLEDVKWVQEQ